jgi:alpha-amylase
MTTARARRGFAILLSAALLGCAGGHATGAGADGGAGPDSLAPAAGTPDASGETAAVVRLGPRPPGAVFVHLFEWRWTDVAKECEAYLGPAGFAGVQVSPPSEHAVLAGFPWWQRYQTVGYELDESRSGTAAEFGDMVARCAAAGVAVYVDAVINHMTAQASGVGSHGTQFTKYAYPGLYDASGFHMPPCLITAADYLDSPDHVRRCELDGLADLDTSSASVRAAIAGYLTSLVQMGVKGFRVDAAKHIAPDDLDAIIGLVHDAVGDSAGVYYYFEVIDLGGEAIHSSDYLPTGQGAAEAVDVIEFKGQAIADAFAGVGGLGISSLRAAGDGWLPSDRAVVFVNNHDTQRATSLYYQDAPGYDLATVFLLAWPYGYPQILSSFAFDRSTQAGRDQGPPSDDAGHTRPVWPPGAKTPDCQDDLTLPTQPAGQWLCEHRRPFVARLVGFRRATVGEPVANEWDDGADVLAFARGAKGFVAINNGASTLERTFVTGLPGGAYCDVYGGEPTASGCSGATITVGADGTADVAIAAGTAVVIHVGAPAGP